jgi:hypothetical protein
MRKGRAFLLAAAAAAGTTAAATAQQTVDGSAIAIREVVAGKTCRGDDVLVFGVSTPGSRGTFERVGRPVGTYSIGYGSILIRREHDLHGHLAAVSLADRKLFLSTGVYSCGQ